MRFQAKETVQTEDSEMVLRVLEICLRDVSSKVERRGHEITLHGLGPSSRAMNHHDTTVLRVNAENDKTIIHADVSFLASAFLGELPQDAVVRSKLKQVFHQMNTQLNIEKRSASSSMAESIATPATEMGIEVIEKSAEVFGGVPPSPMTADVAETFEESVSQTSMLPEDRDQPVLQGGERFVFMQSKRAAALVASIAILLLLTVGIYLLRVYYQRPDSAFASLVPGSTANESGSNSHAVSNDTSTHSTKEQEALSPNAGAYSAMNVSDPKVWLENWGFAMRTRDAVAQATFYADSVNQYQQKRGVSRDALLKEKEAAIADRRGLWTVKLEKIVIERKSGSEVTARLVKHFIEEPRPSVISERFVKSQVQLRHITGQWKITSERDLP